MAEVPRVILKPRKARPFFAGHPWVYVTSVAKVEGFPQSGDEVDVVSQEGRFIARGLFNAQSAIRVRLYRWDGGPLDADFWRERLAAAVRLRREILKLAGAAAACRLVFSEADGLSGLTVDRYADWLAVQFTSLALAQRRETLLPILAELTGVQGILVRTERGIAEREGLEIQDGPAWGMVPDEPICIVEHGLTYHVDLRTGQKTGFYLDQRENRLAVAPLCQGKRVLDLFCYTGAFSLCALHLGGAMQTTGYDASGPAIALARQNAEANGLADRARFETSDVFKAMDALRERGERFEVVICDPPKFARQPKAVEEALRGYVRLNRAAVEVLEPDGILVTCSCSGHVDRQLFADLIAQVSELSARPIQILSQRGQASDHPVVASCLETEYLKCFVCRVL